MYSTDLPTLLMHFSFHEKPLASWAAKSVGNDCAVDESGDGNSSAASTASAKKRKKRNGSSNSATGAGRLLAGAAMYEVMYNVDTSEMTEEERKRHMVRKKRVGDIMDMCLSSLEDAF